MQNTSYSVENYISDIQAVVAAQSDDREITKQIKPLAKRLAANRDWLKDEHRQIDVEQGFGVHLLHEEGDHELAVFVIAWAPGRGTLPHNHRTWAVVAGIEGVEHEVNYDRVDDGSKPGYADLKKTKEETVHAGSVGACLPDDIHSIWNTGDVVSISLHTYGKHLNFTGRSEFDVEKKQERPFIVRVAD